MFNVYSITQNNMFFRPLVTAFFNFPSEACSPHWLGMVEPCGSWGPVTLFECQFLPHLLHTSEGWVHLFLPFLKVTLFLGIPCLQSCFRCLLLPQFIKWNFGVSLYQWKLLLLPKFQYCSHRSQHSLYARSSYLLILIWPLKAQGSFYILSWHFLFFFSSFFLFVLSLWDRVSL